MFTPIRTATLLLIILILAGTFPSLISAQDKKSPNSGRPPILWRDPGDVSARDLTYGPGSADLTPAEPFTFIEEDKSGVSPKFRVKDARGVIWVVKLGVEAQTETVATRIVWGVGYFAEEAYYLEHVEIRNLPRLSRGGEHVVGTKVHGARFEPKRAHITPGPNWDWRKNPFAGTRELDGLKVLMVLLANYDTTPRNNRILTIKNAESGDLEDYYVVTDLGATLGRVGGLGGTRKKNDLEEFAASDFVVEVEDGMVKFDYRTKPEGLGIFASIFNPWYAKGQASKQKAMRRISVENVRWIATLLSAMTDDQLRAAFRVASYDKATMEGFVKAIRGRIDQLARLNG